MLSYEQYKMQAVFLIIQETRTMLKTRPNTAASNTDQNTILFIAPILPGKAEAWRRFIQEMGGARGWEYETSRRQLGIRAERVWISETRHRAIGIILIETDYLEQTLTTLASSAHPFDRWFREQLLALQGVDWARPDATLLPDLIFAWRSDEG
jgi:hypothetical protein